MSPLKVYIAYGFSHAVEYVVFVWAFQRRRYAEPLAHRPLLQRVLKHPVLAYGGFLLVVGGLYFAIELGDDWGLHEGGLRFFGVKWSMWRMLKHRKGIVSSLVRPLHPLVCSKMNMIGMISLSH